MKNKNVIAEYETQIEGQVVTVHTIKPKEKKVISYGRPNTNHCPYCLSSLIVDGSGLQQCSGDKLLFWEGEFSKYFSMDEPSKVNYIQTLSEESQFFELFDRWVITLSLDSVEKFSCGYTNKIFFPMPSGNVTIPDPVRVSNVEKRLGRRLTEEELYGESELWQYAGMVLKDYRKNAKKIKIPLIRFPEDC